jgi:hypothetical protein
VFSADTALCSRLRRSSSASLRTAAAPCAAASNLAEDGQVVEPVLLSVGGSNFSFPVEWQPDAEKLFV